MRHFLDLPPSIPRPPFERGSIVRQDTGERYELVELLGEGATSAVYSARRHGTQCQEAPFAVKILNPLVRVVQTEDGYDRMRKRFAQEAARGKHLSHPNLMRMIGKGTLWQNTPSGFLCCIMERVDGLSLYDSMDRPPPSLLQRVQYAIALGTGLEPICTSEEHCTATSNQPT